MITAPGYSEFIHIGWETRKSKKAMFGLETPAVGLEPENTHNFAEN